MHKEDTLEGEHPDEVARTFSVEFAVSDARYRSVVEAADQA